MFAENAISPTPTPSWKGGIIVCTIPELDISEDGPVLAELIKYLPVSMLLNCASARKVLSR